MASAIGARRCFPQSAGAPQPGALKIVYFDVGQGDAALVTTPSGRKILVDAGPSATLVADRLRALHVDTLDLVVASHNHADHIGGMAAVLSSVVVRNYLEHGMPQTTATYAALVRVLEQRHVPVLRAIPRRIDLGQGTSARVITGPATATTQNNRSIGLLVTHGAFSALFTGDSEGPERAYWEDSAGLGAITALKVSHHGSINGTDARFLNYTHPCIAIISVGNPNKFGHPSPRVLDELRTASVGVYRTDIGGQVMLQGFVDGHVVVSRATGERSGKPAVDQLACTLSGARGS